MKPANLKFQHHALFQSGPIAGFEMCFSPSTLGAGAKTRLESRMKEFTPHCICTYMYVSTVIWTDKFIYTHPMIGLEVESIQLPLQTYAITLQVDGLSHHCIKYCTSAVIWTENCLRYCTHRLRSLLREIHSVKQHGYLPGRAAALFSSFW